MDKIKLLIKQWWCAHNSRETTHTVGDMCVITKTKCCDCGRSVPRHQFEASADTTALELLNKQFGSG